MKQRGHLVVILAAGLSSFGCNASDTKYIERESALPAEVVSKTQCDAENCLIVEAGSEYCSIDPYALEEGAIFRTKSRLTIAPGAYALDGARALEALQITLSSRHGTAALAPSDADAFTTRTSDADEDNEIAPIDWVEVKTSYVGDGVNLDRFFLRTARWPHDQFYLGDPENVGWFFEAGRNLYIRVRGASRIFPGLSGDRTILFAPCLMRDLPDEVFTFELQDEPCAPSAAPVRLDITSAG